ncbi:error-prone DNA polymerase [Brachybacterium kimchii]|uniref:Error-prone DNA polymerase n=1 Tax=Brachybacterium kimchii TaxID=2942909 RepID=A0ABY4NBJ1_9MICO|nr:error-prone DNA polymerase [Brachybacterium kimchii]UQN30785.1 error-prone DNA polymerase [Brachybacterium kimchii]
MSRWFLGPPSWNDLEALLSDRPVPSERALPPQHAPAGEPGEGEPGPSAPSSDGRPGTDIAYAELHAHSHFSFLDGASSPEDMVAEAARLGLRALALVDHDGLPGAVRFSRAAREAGLATVLGAELTLGSEPGSEHASSTPVLSPERTGVPDPEGEHLLVLVRDEQGYRALSAAIARAHLDSRRKATPRYRLAELSRIAREGHWLVLTGCRKGAVLRAVRPLVADGDREGAARAAQREIARLLELYGHGNVAVELMVGGDELDDEIHDALAQGARLVREETGLDELTLPLVATTNAHCARPADTRLVDVHAALRAGTSLAEADPHLPSRPGHLRSGEEMAQLLPRHPEAVAAASRMAEECALDLQLLAPDLPPFPVPAGHTEDSWLRELVEQGGRERYGPRPGSGRKGGASGSDGADGTDRSDAPADEEQVPGAWAQIDRELQVISGLHFPGYFLIVREIVAFCEKEEILCQGRGSAANSAVCYALGITAVEPVGHHLLFERFLAPERDGPPDIDLDIASDRREEVIQHVYERYGRECAAQVANVISYRAKLAVRDAARALGYDVGTQDAWSKRIERSFRSLADADIPADVVELAHRLRDAPRHLGIHSGGMVLADRPVIEICPVQWAAMEDRSVLQWDKDDCADAGLVKFDLLGLGMLTAIDHCLRLVAEHHGEHHGLRTLPQEDPAVYDMLCAGDSVGVFQVESRAQIATLPRLRPVCFYDLVVEVALIRPGPIQGGSVHPYIRRRTGEEETTYLHPLLEKSLGRTYGVPLFQEQLMQMAVDVADFTPALADQLRRAMGSKRSTEKMLALSDQLFAGMARHGITGEDAEAIQRKLLAFANYGFPESHAYSFAYIVYASAYLKCHYPAAFTAALLRSQPMGFYSPQSLVADARRHGVLTRGVDVTVSEVQTGLETDAGDTGDTGGAGDGTGHRAYTLPGNEDVLGPAARHRGPEGWTDPEKDALRAARPQVTGEAARRGPVIRLGLAQVRGIGEDKAEEIVSAREKEGPFASISDLARRVRLSARQLEALATAGALDALASSRRQALWAAGAAAQESPDVLPHLAIGADAPMLPGLSDAELAAADSWATGITLADHPMVLVREEMEEAGVLSIRGAREAEDSTRIRVGGVITHRQRPATASGITFLSLEDETGILNVVCSKGFWSRHRAVLRTSRSVVVRGIVENLTGAVNLVADGVEVLELAGAGRSRDFH